MTFWVFILIGFAFKSVKYDIFTITEFKLSKDLKMKGNNKTKYESSWQHMCTK